MSASGNAPAFSTGLLGIFAVSLMFNHDANSSPIEKKSAFSTDAFPDPSGHLRVNVIVA